MANSEHWILKCVEGCKYVLLHIKTVTPKGRITEKLYSQSLCSIYVHNWVCSKQCAYKGQSHVAHDVGTTVGWTLGWESLDDCDVMGKMYYDDLVIG